MSDAPYSSPGRSKPFSVLSSDSLPATRSAPRSSVLPQLSLSALRRPSLDENMLQKQALLTLKLSSQSFLDSQVFDDASPDPVYVFKTSGNITTLSRTDPWDGETRTGDVKWPRSNKGKRKEDSVFVQVNSGRWTLGSAILQPASITSNSTGRKFSIPGYSKPLKWKPVGKSFWCMASSMKTPIATLDPTTEGVPPRIKIFETLHDKYEDRPMSVHHGVSVILLDWLLITSLLMVTDSQEWVGVRKYENERSVFTDDESSPVVGTSSHWKKIIFREPIFPKRSSGTLGFEPPATPQAAPHSVGQMAKILYGEPIYPSLKSKPSIKSNSTSQLPTSRFNYDSDEEDEDDVVSNLFASGESSSFSQSNFLDTSEDSSSISANFLDISAESSPEPTSSRAPSPSADSVVFHSGRGPNAPNHTYMDPMFYDDAAPPVPPIPPRHLAALELSPPSPTLSTIDFSRVRRLPRLPGEEEDPYDTLIPRSQSTPPMETPTTSASETDDPTPEPTPADDIPMVASMTLPAKLRPISVYRAQSISARQLPAPPPLSPQSSSVSSTQEVVIRRNLQDKRTSQYGMRSLPPTPMSMSLPDHSLAPGRSQNKTVIIDDWSGRSSQDAVPGRISLFDIPPPAYNTINFSGSSDPAYSHRLPPVPPVPPVPPLPPLPPHTNHPSQ